MLRSLCVCIVFGWGSSLVKAVNVLIHRHMGQDMAENATNELQKALDEAKHLFHGSEMELVSRQASESSQKLPAMTTEVKDSLTRLMNSQTLFNQASSKDRTDAEKALEKEIASAMKAPLQVGSPELPEAASEQFTCLPDLNRCPQKWNTHGASLCTAGESYQGPCKSPVSLTGMGTEERLAFAKYCGVEFHCQEDCAQDFEEICPSLWKQIADGVCEAPPSYAGQCQRRVDTSNMSTADRATFALKCGARWACSPPASHKYSDVCPEKWSLKSGSVCVAPHGYHGPCPSLVRMKGMSSIAKQKFEVDCEVTWPLIHACKRDYTAKCPVGWRHVTRRGQIECEAPAWFTKCGRIQRFSHMTPDQKQIWENKCFQRFPCRSRVSCVKDWATACPADWFAFNGGTSCRAPETYIGPCELVLDGMSTLSSDEKADIASRCKVTWPCQGEIDAQAPDVDGPRRASKVTWLNGPVDISTGRVRSRRA